MGAASSPRGGGSSVELDKAKHSAVARSAIAGEAPRVATTAYWRKTSGMQKKRKVLSHSAKQTSLATEWETSRNYESQTWKADPSAATYNNFSNSSYINSDYPVVTVSLHMENNYPWTKMNSDLDVGFGDNADDALYLEKLEEALKWIERRGRERKAMLARQTLTECSDMLGRGEIACIGPLFDLAIYVAGADPFEKDPLGGMQISKGALHKRDKTVANWCRSSGIPMAVVLAGGYSDVEDVVDIHLNTFLSCFEERLGCLGLEAFG